MHDHVTPPAWTIETAEIAGVEAPRRPRRIRLSLATRVLILFATLVMVANIAVCVPSIGNFHDNWLRNRLSAGYTAALVLESAQRSILPDTVSRPLLDSVGARIIVLKMRGTRRILAASEMPPKVDEVYDLQRPSFVGMLMATYRTLTSGSGRVLTILGAAPIVEGTVEITLDEAPLKAALENASRRILLSSLVTSLIAATLAMLAIHFTMLRPVRRLTTNLMAFAHDPEDARHIIVPSGRQHEIGRAEAALAVMESALARELGQKKRLAALGLAVAKINHDMRNMLAAAQLLSDRLANLTDPLAQRLAPKLVATLDRAIRFCQATLTYGRAVDDPPKLATVALRGLVTDAAETAAVAGQGGVEVVNHVPNGFDVFVDSEQMFRVLMNLIRNGIEALERAGPAPGRPARVDISATREAGQIFIEVADTGPGVPESARENLFSPFLSATRPGNSGLGLAIAGDLVRGHGGELVLLDSPGDDPGGARFRIVLPLAASNMH